MRQQSKRTAFLVFLISAIILVCGLVAAIFWFRAHTLPQIAVQILSPVPDALVTVGEANPVRVAVNGKGTTRIELSVDGQQVSTVPNPDPDQNGTWVVTESWKAWEEGRHLLEVRAFQNGQDVAASASVPIEAVPPGTIAFASNRSGNYQIFTSKSDGTEVHSRTTDSQNHGQSSWSPTGALAVVVGPAEGPTVIQQIAQDGSQRPVTSWVARNRDPAWNPLGGWIAFRSDRQGAENVYLQKLSGGDPVAVTHERFYAGQPSWAPNGKTLAVTIQRDGNWDIYRVDATGENLERLTSGGAQDWFPAWSPAGETIAFVSNRSGTQQLYLMQPDGSEQQRITNLPRGVESPAWSPDGRWLVFVAYTGTGEGENARELHLIRVADGHKVRITRNAYDDSAPTWLYPPPSVTGLTVPPRTGFSAEYYSNMTLSGAPTLLRFDPNLDFDWGNGAPAAEMPADHFSVRWLGRVTALKERDYLFSVDTDGGVRLWVDGSLLIDGWSISSPESYTVPAHLLPGDHVIRLEYYENEGPAYIKLHWQIGP